MKSAFLTFLSVILLASAAQASLENFEEGMDWYEKKALGAVGFKAKPEYINKAIAFFERAIAANENELETGVYLLRSYIWKARFTQEDKGDKRKTFKLAKELGDKLIPKYPESRELRFEYLSAMGQWGDVMGVLRAIKEGVVGKVRSQMEALIALDPEFRKAVGIRALAVLNLRVPKIPFIMSWPDKKKALTMTKEVVEKYPNDIGNNFYHAEALVKNDRDQEAISYLNKALSIEPEAEYLLEDRYSHMEAREMLADIEY
ncbi:MAG: tetratricopeptide (TPR) repeat protein [Bacteroidia bacterium]|jgi:tetratricopeptide (TPR) repeat protein